MKMYGLKTKAPDSFPEPTYIEANSTTCTVDVSGIFIIRANRDLQIVQVPVAGICHIYLEIVSPDISVSIQMKGILRDDSDIYHSVTVGAAGSSVDIFGRVIVENGMTIYRSLCSDMSHQTKIVQDVSFLRGVGTAVVTEPAIQIENNKSSAVHSVSVRIPDAETLFLLNACGLSAAQAYTVYTNSFIS